MTGTPFAAELARLAVDAQTRRVVLALRAAGVEPVLLKGPAHAAWLYRDPSSRSYRDTDLLVGRGGLGSAAAVLTALGYFPAPSAAGGKEPSTTWVHGASGLEVDLHTTIWGWGAPDAVWAEVDQRTGWIRVAGVDVRVADAAARAVHVVTHALQGFGSDARANLDLDRALALLDDEEWAVAAVRAERVGATAAFVAGLAGHPVGAELVGRLGLRAPCAMGADLTLAVLGVPGGRTIARLVEASSLRGRLAVVRSVVVPSYAFVRRVVPGSHLRTTTRGLAYLRYWARLVVRSGAAVGALVRAGGRRSQEMPERARALR